MLYVLSGCASYAERNPEKIVRQRVAERWDALIEGRLESAYSFETPEYREIYSFPEYRMTIHGVGAWRKVEIDDVECVDDKCVASIVIYANITLGKGFGAVDSNAPAKESWVRDSISEQWFHVSEH
ncbi:hypothetical protein AU255_02020 [Methyloprofundus sedimenti]|uniref:Uncharacterized protein n=1 Tax=Methyloprofundus sedimenti TaxID=1420851 RepID=A0A1V8M567_9GAMM|nr:hypothetical protein [Methyloprofundus sedimenti]OQK16707.1 hypothetical protein AU255_02020 [Methyloprofundus sedimenti]